MKHNKHSTVTPISFLDFWRFIAKELGNSRLKINVNARSIHDFLITDGDQKAYLRDAIKRSYKLNKCHHLGSIICVISVLDILGETAYQLQSSKQDDLFDIELLEEIAWHISHRFADHFELKDGSNSASSLASSDMDNKVSRNNVSSLPKAKIRRANSRL